MTVSDGSYMADNLGKVKTMDDLVGSRLHELRTGQGLSLRVLADRSGLNINTLSLIEHGKSSPSVSTLQQLANALNVQIGAFFEEQPRSLRVVHFRACHARHSTGIGIIMENLGKNLENHAVQPFLVTLPAGAGSGASPIVHTGHEFVYCLAGILDYEIENQSYLLEPGDSLVFQAHLPHRWQNTSLEECRIMLVIFPADHHDVSIDRHFPEPMETGRIS